MCVYKQASFLNIFFTPTVPIFLAFFITITLDAYISIKAYQVYKRIQKENGAEKQISKDKLRKTLQQLKPMITLLVTILGSTTIAVITAITYRTASMTTEGGPLLVRNFILSNLPYLDLLLHTLVYGLYFRKIRQPLCRRLKRMVRSCKFNKNMNTISPSQIRSIQRAWM